MNRKIRFDDSLERFVHIVTDILGGDAFERGRAVRDAYGRLSYVASVELGEEAAGRLRRALAEGLGAYAPEETAVLDRSDFGAEGLLAAHAMWRFLETDAGRPVWVDVVDRRIVGQDWVAPPPEEPDPAPPRLLFSSMKGGVGRTTALCVLASHLAQQGRNVLVIDADLEAPGLGGLLLAPEERPAFGLVDYLVENSFDGWTRDELDQFVGQSFLSDRGGGQGLVDVAPAIGQCSVDHPADMLAKLSRAMLERPRQDAPPQSVRAQLRAFVDVIAARRNYDAVLIDGRAGLSELAGSVMLGLGARILLFGVNQLQTFEDYRFLLAHLAHLPAPADGRRDWRRGLRFVHSKADPEGDDIASFRDRLYDVVSAEFYEEEQGDSESFVYSVDDPQAPHHPFVIHFDFPYLRFDPARNPEHLQRETYQAGFLEFLSGACAMLKLTEQEG